jgi:hypothetical protein
MKTDPSPAPDDSGPDAIRRNFAAVAAATDTPAPGDGSSLLTVPLSLRINELSRRVGFILRPAPIFRFGDTIATVDEEGRIAGMNPDRFCSWVEDYLAFTKLGKDPPTAESITKETAGKIMAADSFKNQLHELKAVAEVRLPVWTGKGPERTVRLAPAGFDEDTGLYTVDRIPYADDMPDEAAVRWLWEAMKDFPWSAEGEKNPSHRRSFAAQVAAMVGIYCRLLFPDGTARPMVIYNANQPGSGKSLLMRMALAPVHGAPAESGKPDAESEFEKVLDSAAMGRKPYLVLDDCRSIRSQALNRFVTSPIHENRQMHSQRLPTNPKVTQVFATGNGLAVSPDLDRRALIVDLQEPGEATARKFSKEITPEWLFSIETRAQFLAALWSLVRRWRDAGMPRIQEHRRGSFEDWSGLVGGVVVAWGLCNPFKPREAEFGGDEAGRALKIVLCQLADVALAGTPLILKTEDILARAESAGLLELIVSPDKNPQKSLGWVIKALGLPRNLTDGQGRVFEFKRRKMADGTGYEINFL